MTKVLQPRLFIVAQSDSKFIRETLRRGGPREVQGKGWRKRPKPVKSGDMIVHPDVAAAMNVTLKKMR